MKRIATTFLALAFASGAQAATVNFNFGTPTGNLGNTHTYLDTGGSGLQIVASGFNASNAPTALFGKNAGGDEIGLGLANDPSGENEIHFGFGFVQLDVSNLFGKVTGAQFATNSTTEGEQWSVFGSNTAGSFSGAALASGTVEGVLTALPGFGTFRCYDFVSTSQSGGQNFLIARVTANAVPEPATWAAMLLGFGLVGSVSRRRHRMAAIAT